MSLTRDFPIYRDTLLAHSGSTDLGGGDDEHLPVGMAGSYNCKAALKFTLDFSGMTNIVSAVLYCKTTTKVHATSWGATPTIIIERLDSGNFTENGGRSSYDSPAGSGWSTAGSNFGSAAVDPGVNDINWTTGNNESTWYSKDITAIVKAWGPTSIPGCSGAANYGILLRPTANATSETVEFYSRKAGSGAAYIRVTYDSNTAPNAPTSPAPANGAVITGAATPTFSWLYDDPQGDASSGYHLQVSTDPTFATTLWDTGVVALVQADNTTMSRVAGVSFARGVTYYWRVATLDAAGLVSAWSSTWNFTINTLPVGTLTEPSATGRIAKVTYQAGAGWTQPRLLVEWTYSDAQGQAQAQYEIDVRVDSGGSPGTVIVNTVVVDSVNWHLVTQNIIENTRYHIRVRVHDGLEWSNWSGYFIVRARWGYTVHQKDVRIGGVPPTQWSIQALNAPFDPASQLVVVEYNSCDDAAGTNLAAVWQSSLGAVTKRNYFRYRVWFMTWGASPAALPQLADLTIRTSGQTIQPERWLPAPISSQKGSIELGDRVFGTQSLRIDGDGSAHYITQQVRVEPGENYILQTRLRSIGNSGAKVYLSDTQNGAPLTVTAGTVQTAPATGDLAWAQRTAPVWNSGSRSVVWVTCYVNGAAGTVGLFDGLKMERGQVSSPWTPGLVGTGVAIDSGGVQIDATNSSGAIFRLRTSAGNVIELGSSSLELDGAPILPAAAFVPPIRRVYTANDTWTKPAGLAYAEVEVVGGGGAGGGPSATGAGESSAPAGGGGGGYAKKLFTAADLAGLTTATVTIGAGGTAVSGAAGNNGNPSSFAGTGITTLTGNGGLAGAGMATGTTAGTRSTPGGGGTATGGDVNMQGGSGWSGVRTTAGAPNAGHGGSSMLATEQHATAGSVAGNPGHAYGGGGSGGSNDSSQGARLGGAGAAGAVIVTEYYG